MAVESGSKATADVAARTCRAHQVVQVSSATAIFDQYGAQDKGFEAQFLLAKDFN